MTKTEELAHYERNKEKNLRMIRAKLVHANAAQLAWIAALIRGLEIEGWDNTEYHRPVPERKKVSA